MLVRRVLRAAAESRQPFLWVGDARCYYGLPPILHSCIKHTTPRILQPSVRQHFLRRLKDKIGPTTPVETPADCQPAPDLDGDLTHTIPDSGLPVPLSPALAALERFLCTTASQRVHLYRELYAAPESRRRMIEEKANRCREALKHCFLDRVRVYRELARLEELIGNHVMACTYRLRALRLQGEDLGHDLAYLRRQLPLCGFPAVAGAAVALYSGSSGSELACQELLQEALERHRHPPVLEPFAFVEDRRQNHGYRVSIIVSLYNAAAKLPLFLHTLACQKLVRSGQAEIILIDSASPAEEYKALSATRLDVPLHYVFARTTRREPIQTAWNRGIGLATAPFLTFLGVDEAIVPDALSTLADELDANPDIDWVQGDSIVTDVDANGAFVKDVITYNRDGYSQGMVYLDTCYLSYVGALYRRSIHDRVGYYDGSFCAAGDTEFKLRAAPFIRSRHVPRLLGVFLNYPEERTTQSPLAEVEDLAPGTCTGVWVGFAMPSTGLIPGTFSIYYTSRCLTANHSRGTAAATSIMPSRLSSTWNAGPARCWTAVWQETSLSWREPITALIMRRTSGKSRYEPHSVKPWVTSNASRDDCAVRLSWT